METNLTEVFVAEDDTSKSTIVDQDDCHKQVGVRNVSLV
jgi:hypothetical protein